MIPARRAALLRLLADWEAGNTHEWFSISEEIPCLCQEGLIHGSRLGGYIFYTLTPAGLTAARAIREAGE